MRNPVLEVLDWFNVEFTIVLDLYIVSTLLALKLKLVPSFANMYLDGKGT